MSRVYLADAVPDVIRVPLLLATQDNVAQYWRDRTSLTSADVPRSVSLTNTSATRRPRSRPQTESWTSASRHVLQTGNPQRTQRCLADWGQSHASPPEGLPYARGYPGFDRCRRVQSEHPQVRTSRMVDGEAPLLYAFATRSLEQFPEALIDEAPDTAVDNGRALVACAYYETRIRE